MKQSYKVTQVFTAGILAGITITETRDHPVEVGKVYTSCVTGAAYKIISCEKI
jgi:hypothetical protein